MDMYERYGFSLAAAEEKRQPKPLQTQSRKAEYRKRLGYPNGFPKVEEPTGFQSNCRFTIGSLIAVK